MIGLGVHNVTREITAERLDTAANSIEPSVVATTAAQPIIAEQVVVDNGEWQGTPDRALFEAWHAAARVPVWSAPFSVSASVDVDTVWIARVVPSERGTSPVSMAAWSEAPATHALSLSTTVN